MKSFFSENPEYVMGLTIFGFLVFIFLLVAADARIRQAQERECIVAAGKAGYSANEALLLCIKR